MHLMTAMGQCDSDRPMDERLWDVDDVLILFMKMQDEGLNTNTILDGFLLMYNLTNTNIAGIYLLKTKLFFFFSSLGDYGFSLKKWPKTHTLFQTHMDPLYMKKKTVLI